MALANPEAATLEHPVFGENPESPVYLGFQDSQVYLVREVSDAGGTEREERKCWCVCERERISDEESMCV